MAGRTDSGDKKPKNRWNEVPKRNRTDVRASAAKRRRDALDMRIKGHTYQEIADELGYASKGAAHQAVSGELKNIPREKAEEAREAEMTRLDALQKAVMVPALAGDILAVDRVLKVIQERSRLLGLYDLAEAEDPEAQRTKAALNEFLAQAAKAVSSGASES